VPLYEYRCKQCGHQFEKIQSFSAPEEKECPVCQGEVERLLSAPAIQFKGSGWYVNDYAAKKSGPMKASADGAAKGDGAKAGEGGSSSEKPAASSSESGASSSGSSSSSSTTARKSE
jgi:putative FmdB family regulatory protein